MNEKDTTNAGARRIKSVLHLISYVVQSQILHKEIPLMGDLVITERCNLRCKQCRVAHRDAPNLSYEGAQQGLYTLYHKGARSLYITGGEPFLWKDRRYELEDVVRLAQQIGFHFVSVYTNGTFPIDISADSVFVSLDGLRETNNRLRGDVFDDVIANVQQSGHPNIIITFTINKINHQELEEFCDAVRSLREARGIFFSFHTPYYGYDELFLTMEEKRGIIKRILALRKKGHRILNSSACLDAVYKDRWVRPSKLCYVYANHSLYQCCRAIGNDDACSHCGYLGLPEILCALKLRPTALLSALNYLKGRQ